MADQVFTPRLSAKGRWAWNIPAIARDMHPNAPPAVLLTGSRYSTKTWSLEHLVLRHLWETPGARFCIFAKALKTLTDAGPWKLLMDYILPEWIEGLDGFAVTTKDRAGVEGGIADSKTRTILMRVTNAYGGESEIQLNSIQHDGEIAIKLKSTFYSGFWFSELSQWEDPSIFRTSLMSLRMPHLEPWQHLWVADTNPSKQGPDSWIYKRWFLKDKPQTKSEIEMLGQTSDELRKSLHMKEFFLDDNPFISEERKDVIRNTYIDDPLEYEREINGKWVKGLAKNKLFSSVFSQTTHVIGDQVGENGDIDLAPDTDHLDSGWDLGSGTNHASGIIEKRIVEVPPKAAGLDPTFVSVFCILDSLTTTGEHVMIQDFTLQFMEKQKAIQDRYPNRKFDYTHYADDSAINQPRASGAGYDYLEVLVASANEIRLTGVPKPNHSVGVRIRLVRRLLREGRLFTAAKCKDVIAMFEEASSGKEEEIEWNEYKHVFDWISYVLYMLCFDELEESVRKPRGATHESNVSVPL